VTLLDQITDLADGLTEPHVNREPYTVWTGSRHRQTRHHVTVQHGLLRQLYTAVVPSWATSDEPGAGVPKSRPPLEVEALSRHEQITEAARAWCADAGVDARPTVESTIRALVGAASALGDENQRALLADLRRWSSWCRVYLGLEQVRRIVGARCPLADCNTLGSLRINLTTSYGMCTACEAVWDRDTIGVLAEHIRAGRSTEGASA